jgi:hypothetical protein
MGVIMDRDVSKKSIVSARRVYWWLLLVPVFAVPFWWLIIPYNPNFGEILGPSLFALVFYLPILIWATSDNPFIQVHARQGLILLALRFLSPLLIFLVFGWDAMLPLFIVVNGSLWLFGSMFGLAQVGNGTSFLPFDRSKIVADPISDQTPHAEILISSLDEARASLIAGERSLSIKQALAVFRNDDAASKESAMKFLAELGEVEEF